MKKVSLIILLQSFTFLINAQSFIGDWEGKLVAAQRSIDIVFHIKNAKDGSYSASLDVPIQKAYNIAASEVTVTNNNIVIVIKAASIKFEGELLDDKNLKGKWIQGGLTIQVPLKKTSDVPKEKTFIRPQTPKPPFPYISEEVEFDNKNKSIHFGATLTIPSSGGTKNEAGKSLYPVAILITGSGKQDRDETMFEHKPFAIIADYLAKKGIAVLRMDDREMGKSTGDFMSSTTFDFVNDIEAGLEYLKSREEIDTRNIGLVGHSEGGLIASILASKREDVKFVVLMASPGVKSTELIEQQTSSMAVSHGVSLKSIGEMKPMLNNLVSAIINAPDTASARINGIKIFKDWQENQSKTLVRNTTGVTDEVSMNSYVNKLVVTLKLPWYVTFMKIDPGVYLTGIKCSVLAINGEKDIQVDAKTNLEAIEKYIKQGGNKNVETKVIKDLNHLFQHCKKCTFEEYSDLQESIAPEVLEILANWISEKVK
ncbi:MAG: alpha/beta fold hydrolase [Sphingobacteriia bacterium]|jgi:alpha/beta superfamily hydrolase